LKGFATGKHRVLVATDVAARGIDVSDIAHVVNYDCQCQRRLRPPHWTHRTRRSQWSGDNLRDAQERHDARKMERELKDQV